MEVQIAKPGEPAQVIYRRYDSPETTFGVVVQDAEGVERGLLLISVQLTRVEDITFMKGFIVSLIEFSSHAVATGKFPMPHVFRTLPAEWLRARDTRVHVLRQGEMISLGVEAAIRVIVTSVTFIYPLLVDEAVFDVQVV